MSDTRRGTPRALIIHGGWEGHRPRECAARAAAILRSEGFDVELSDSLDPLDQPSSLGALALVVPCWTMGSLTPEQESNLCDAVERGTGLAGWHGGMGDAFRANTRFQFMTGGQFVAHPGDIRPYEVRIERANDPIVAGIPGFEVVSEQYYMHVDPAVRVLATTRFDGVGAPWVAGTVMPVVWTKPWGAGSVFYSSIGHSPEDLDIPPVREILRRGMLWVSGLPAASPRPSTLLA